MYPRILARVFGWVKGHGKCSIEFEKRGSEISVMMRTWKRSTFRRVCVAVLSRFSVNTTLEATVLGKILDAAGPDTAVVSLHGVPHVLAEVFASYLGSWYQAKLIEHPTFDLRLLKRCLEGTASSVFGSLDPFSLTEFVVNRFKGAETRDWMASRPALRKAIVTNDLSMAGYVDVVVNIVGLWPLIVSFLKETGRKDEGDSLVVRSFLVGICLTRGGVPITLCCFLKKGMDGYLYHDTLARMKFRLFHLLVEICKYHHHLVIMVRVGT